VEEVLSLVVPRRMLQLVIDAAVITRASLTQWRIVTRRQRRWLVVVPMDVVISVA
jgi:hypothetical protein